MDIFINSHIVMLTETWANDFTNLQVDGFTYFNVNRRERKPGSKRDSGGIIIYVKNALISSASNTLYKQKVMIFYGLD